MKKTVVITGASSGIGRATALEFARTGANVVLASRQKQALGDVAAQCEGLGAATMAVVTDTAENDQVKNLAHAAIERFGQIDVWVNNASISSYGSLTAIPLKDIRRVLDVNLLGYVYGTRQALKAFERTGRGAIVNVASIIGEIPQPYAAPYSMAKAAVRALGGTVRQELALEKKKGISISTVLPPTIDTPFFRNAANHSGRALLAMPPVYPPELVATTIVRAASKPRAEYVVGALGKVFVRQHRRHPRVIEAQMALQANVAQLSLTEGAPDTSGNLYEPRAASQAAVTGGWNGRRRHSIRKAVGAAVILGGGALALNRALRGVR